MKTILSATVLVLIMIFGYVETQSQKVKPAASSPVVSWRQLGLTVINFNTDRDEIIVTSGENVKKIKFKVSDAPIEILDLNVIYGNDVMDKLPVNAVMQAGGESPIINLKVTERPLRKVEFRFRSPKGVHSGKARVVLLGI